MAPAKRLFNLLPFSPLLLLHASSPYPSPLSVPQRWENSLDSLTAALSVSNYAIKKQHSIIEKTGPDAFFICSLLSLNNLFSTRFLVHLSAPCWSKKNNSRVDVEIMYLTCIAKWSNARQSFSPITVCGSTSEGNTSSQAHTARTTLLTQGDQ